MGKLQAKEWLKAGYSDLKSIEYIVEDDFLTHIININKIKDIVCVE